jgi:hypothetical protein
MIGVQGDTLRGGDMLMPDPSPTGWKERAEQLRRRAMSEPDPVEQQTLLMLAADCEEMAAKEGATDRG